MGPKPPLRVGDPAPPIGALGNGDGTICGLGSPEWSYGCERPRGHAGKHIVCTSWRVVAVWLEGEFAEELEPA